MSETGLIENCAEEYRGNQQKGADRRNNADQ